jgi:hypothetical protein
MHRALNVEHAGNIFLLPQLSLFSLKVALIYEKMCIIIKVFE